jgi:DNA-binding transcriptional ArsR family regulator
MVSPEPRFARIAAMIGDPTRARMLSALMGGQYIAAGELAQAAGVSAQTASGHINKLLESELVVLRTQGRHRYLRLADADIAHVLEALCLVAERGASAAKWEQGAYKPLKAARTCYSHLAGELGVALFEGLIARGTITPQDGYFVLSETGRRELAALGVALEPTPISDSPAQKAQARRYAYPCLDWSERRDHLAGGLAAALLAHAVAQGWLRRVRDSRALTLTPLGHRALAPWIGRADSSSPKLPAATEVESSRQLTSQLS